MKLYFVRHGHTDASTDSKPSTDGGEIDEPLNAVGIQQAKDLAEELKDIHFDAIITSPMKRAYQTAEAVKVYHDLPFIVDAAWREREVGGYVELEVWKTLFDFDTNITPPRGENLQDFFERIYTAIERLKDSYKDKTVLIVSHGGVHLAVYTYANNFPLTGKLQIDPLKNCEYRVYEI